MVGVIVALVVALFVKVLSGSERLLVTKGPEGYSIAAGVSGPMDLEEAITSTGSSVEAKREVLRLAGFDGGAIRLWRKEEQFAGVFMFELKDKKGAELLMGFELDQIAGRAERAMTEQSIESAAFFDPKGIPAAHGFLLTGTDRRKSAPLIIEGMWFVSKNRAFLVETGGPGSTPLEVVEALGRRQYDKVK